MKNVAIVGFGAMGQMHAQCLQFVQGAQLCGVVSGNGGAAAAAFDRMNIGAPVFSTLDELFQQVACDAVSLCLPTHLHLETGLKILRSGKHLLCEKPLARTVNEAQQLVGAAKSTGLVLMVGQCIRFWPEYQVLEEFVTSHKGGKLLSLTMHRLCSTPVYSSGSWLQDEAKSGGAAFDLHIHDTDYVLHLLGKPRAVTSIGTRDQMGWSHVFTQYGFDEIAVSAQGGWNYPQGWGFSMGYEAVFEQGVLKYDYTQDPTLSFFGKGGKPEAVEVPRRQFSSLGTMTGNIPDLDAYVAELEYFVGCLETGEQPRIASAEQALETLAVVAAEIQSLETRQMVAIL
jgi:predicted dehydrogenase